MMMIIISSYNEFCKKYAEETQTLEKDIKTRLAKMFDCMAKDGGLAVVARALNDGGSLMFEAGEAVYLRIGRRVKPIKYDNPNS